MDLEGGGRGREKERKGVWWQQSHGMNGYTRGADVLVTHAARPCTLTHTRRAVPVS